MVYGGAGGAAAGPCSRAEKTGYSGERYPPQACRKGHLLPPQDGAEQDGGSVNHAAQAQGRPQGGFGADFVHHVPVQVGLADPEEGEEDDDVAPDGDEQPGDGILKEGRAEEGGRHHQAEDAQRAREEQVFHLRDHQHQEHGACKLEQPPDAFKFRQPHPEVTQDAQPFRSHQQEEPEQADGQQDLRQQVVARGGKQEGLHLAPFQQGIKMDQQQDGTQHIPGHMQRYHSIIRMQKGGVLVHLNANLNDYPGFVKANQREREENSTGFPAPCRGDFPQRAEKGGSGILGDLFKRGVFNGGDFPVRVKHHDASLVAFQGRNHDFLKVLFRDDAAPVNGDAVADPGLAPESLAARHVHGAALPVVQPAGVGDGVRAGGKVGVFRREDVRALVSRAAEGVRQHVRLLVVPGDQVRLFRVHDGGQGVPPVAAFAGRQKAVLHAAGRELAAVLACEFLAPVTDAAQVVRAARSGRRLRGMGVNAVGDACQQGDDGDDYENFNERETFAA